jgi:glutamate synthase domain-containing protein 3
MKAFADNKPLLVIGGRARDFLGEYMAGGEIVVLGLGDEEGPIVGSYCGTGMHAGIMYIRGQVAEHQLGKEVRVDSPSESDITRIEEIVSDYSRVMGVDAQEILEKPFIKIYPYTSRPYGRLYVY